jgi:hypothetical protein
MNEEEQKMKKLRLNKKGQGTTEYIIIVALVAGLAVALLLKDGPLRKALDGGINGISTKIQEATK